MLLQSDGISKDARLYFECYYILHVINNTVIYNLFNETFILYDNSMFLQQS